MPFDRDADRLEDIREAIELAKQFISGTYDEFAQDTKTIFAVVRCLEIISEASRRVDQGFRDRHPDLPWVQIAAAGNVYRHDYRMVRTDIVWETVQKALPPLLEAIEAELGPAP